MAPAIMTSAWMRGSFGGSEQLLGGRGFEMPEKTRTSLGYMSETLATKTRWLPKGRMTSCGRGAPAPNREALSMTKSNAPTLRTRPESTRALDGKDGPVRISIPVDASVGPTVGANCHRNVMADAMGMAKVRGKTEVSVDGAENEIGDMHSETPRCTQVQGSRER